MRVTIDLDDTKQEKLKMKADLLKMSYPESDVRYRVSSGGCGGHIEMYSSEIDESLMYNIRCLLGDHDKRLHIDLSRGNNDNPMLPKQVLFDFKIVKGEIKRAGEWIYV